jgi:hypothetical protein
MPSLAISDIAISPVNNNIIYAGSGNYSSAGGGDVFAPGVGDNAAGVYKSRDGGASWTVSNPNGIFDGLRIRRVIPTTLNGGQTVFAATTDTGVDSAGKVVRGGVYRSNDGGKTWTRLSGSSQLPNTGVTDLVANPGNAKQFFAAIAGQAGGASPNDTPNPSNASGIYRLDLSAPTPTWVDITDNIKTLKPHVLENAVRVELAVSKAAGNPIWVTTIDSVDNKFEEFSYSGVFRAPNAATPTWTAIAPPDVLIEFTGDSKGCMLADPNDANALYVGGDLRDASPYTAYVARYDNARGTWTNITPNTAFARVTKVARIGNVATLTTDQAFEVGQTVEVADLTDGTFNGTVQITAVTHGPSGHTFSYSSPGPDTTATPVTKGRVFDLFGPGTVVPIQTSVGSGAHPDARGMQFGFGGDLLLACDGGVYRCTNPTGAGDRVVWSSINGSMQITEFYQVALDNRGNTNPADDLILGAAQDNGNSERMPNGTWVEHTGGDGVVVLADPTSATRYFSVSNYYFASITGQNAIAYPLGTVVGTTKQLNTAQGGELAEELPFNVVLVLDQGEIAKSVNPARILLAGNKTLYVSSDQGNTYTSIGGLGGKDNTTPQPVPNITASITTMAIGSAANTNAAYVCTSDGYISVTQNITASMGGFSTHVKLPGGDIAQNIVIDPNDAMTAYVVTPTKVFMTTNGGSLWTSITDNLETLVSPYARNIAFRTDSYPDSRSIALFNNGTATKADDWVLVGEPGGVFRRMVAPPASLATNTWQSFGAGTTLPNTLVTSLVYDTKSNVLLAGTLGRGAWLLKNASFAINTGVYNGTLIIAGTSGNDLIQIILGGTDWNAVQLILNGKNLGSFGGITGQVSINGLGGQDRVDVARGVRLPVVLDSVAVNPALGNVVAPLAYRIVDKALLAHDHLDDLLAASESHLLGNMPAAQINPKPATLTQALLKPSQAKGADSKPRAGAAIAQALAQLPLADRSKPKKHQ